MARAPTLTNTLTTPPPEDELTATLPVVDESALETPPESAEPEPVAEPEPAPEPVPETQPQPEPTPEPYSPHADRPAPTRTAHEAILAIRPGFNPHADRPAIGTPAVA